MRRVGLAILAAAALLVSAVPAWSGDDGQEAPVASLSVSPQSVTAGDAVALDASGSRDSDGSVVSYAWDLDGDGAYERQSGAQGTLAHAFETAGTHSVAVRVVDDSGQSSDARASVTVAEPQPEPEPQPAAAPEPEAAPAAAPEPEAAPEPQAADPAAPSGGEKGRAKRSEAKRDAPPAEEPTRVQTAGSATVSIEDFAFAPKSVTVGVGDTVTWRNTGAEPHTATARDGSFDTGNLASGQSGSATFSKAGTFSYFCKPHPFMTASVRVTGGGGGSGGSGGGSSGSGGSGGGTQGVTGAGDGGTDTGSAGTTGGDSLPSTGLALAPFLVVGFSMIGSGLALRRRCATPRA